MVFNECLDLDNDDLLKQHNGLFNLLIGLISYCEYILQYKPVRVVFGKCLDLDNDDLLKQRDNLFDLPIDLIGSYEFVLRCEPVKIVFGKMTIPPLTNLYQILNNFFDPSIHPQTPPNPKAQIGFLLYIKLFIMLQYLKDMRKILLLQVTIRIIVI